MPPRARLGRSGGKKMARILFVEYHATFRQAASYLMDQEPDLEVVAQGGSVAEGREKMAEGAIDPAVGDVPPPAPGGEDMPRDLHRPNPAVPVLVMTHIGERDVHER